MATTKGRLIPEELELLEDELELVEDELELLEDELELEDEVLLEEEELLEDPVGVLSAPQPASAIAANTGRTQPESGFRFMFVIGDFQNALPRVIINISSPNCTLTHSRAKNCAPGHSLLALRPFDSFHTFCIDCEITLF
jgi:hypothetical protein